MIMRFATKRDINGNRYFLGIDTDNKTFARESAHYYCKDDLDGELTKTKRHAFIDRLIDNGFSEIDHI